MYFLCNECCSIWFKKNNQYSLYYYCNVDSYILCNSSCDVSNIEKTCILINKKEVEMYKLLYHK